MGGGNQASSFPVLYFGVKAKRGRSGVEKRREKREDKEERERIQGSNEHEGVTKRLRPASSSRCLLERGERTRGER